MRLGRRARGASPATAAAPSTRTRAAYADVPYPGLPFPQTHPGRLAANARLMGLAAAPPESCRVLELGCGDGGNLIPMAAGLPGAELVGLDLSPEAIARAGERADVLGVDNARFLEADLADLDPAELGSFDYLIAHGVYSWVPPAVAARVLEICRAVLEKRGVAYVSYNALPGGHLRATVWDALRFHARDRERPEERLEAAREMLAALTAGIPGDDPYRRFSAAYAERLAGRGDAVVYHDDLEPENRPLMFTDFVADAAEHALQYLAEADWFEMSSDALPAETADLLAASGGGRVEREQYLDFLKCRAYRQTLLCRSGTRLSGPDPAAARGLCAAAQVRPSSPKASVADRSRVEFRTPRNTTLTTDHPLLKAGLAALGEAWPRRLPFDDVAERAGSLAGAEPDEAGRAALADLLLRGYDANVIYLSAHGPAVAAAPGDRPRSSAFARRQIALGDETLTTLHHEPVALDERMRRLVELADGTRDSEALAAELGTKRQLNENLDRLAGLALLEE